MNSAMTSKCQLLTEGIYSKIHQVKYQSMKASKHSCIISSYDIIHNYVYYENGL